MSLAAIALVALSITILASVLLPRMNAGIIAITLSAVVGLFFAGMTEKSIATLFPSGLFLTLVGVTLLFSIAETNGLLNVIAHRSIRMLKGNTVLLPLLFFLFSFLLSAAGPGNIAATAVLAPIGMSIAHQYGVSGFLMAVMICTGANAGAFSPIAPTGIILAGLSQKIQITDSLVLFRVFLFAAVIQSLTALTAYVLFGFKKTHKKESVHAETKAGQKSLPPFTAKHRITSVSILLLIMGVALLKLPLGLTAFALATVLLMLQVSDSEDSVRKIPWDAILLVTGVSVLIGVMEKAGGIELATTLIARVSTAGTINAVMALFTGLISAYSSSSGVVMPTFIPLIPGILAKLGATDAVSLLVAIAVGSHMVDVSPLSTLGALCIANAKENKQVLFRNLMFWGLSMGLVGSILSFVFLDLL